MQATVRTYLREIDGDGFSIRLLESEMEVEFQAFVRFRTRVYEEAAEAKGTDGAFRIFKSGFVSELQTTHKKWADVVAAMSHEDPRVHLVLAPKRSIVGFLKFALTREPPAYTNVLYLGRELRLGVHPHLVFAALCDEYELDEVVAGKVESQDGRRHLKKCGFAGLSHWTRKKR